jgi:hypothetical protein
MAQEDSERGLDFSCGWNLPKKDKEDKYGDREKRLA